MKKHFLIGLILLTSSYLMKAAGPVTHVLLADMWLDTCGKHYTEDERRIFLVGTLYPDIRYLAELPRTATHLSKVNLKEIAQEPDIFKAGSMFHSWVDNAREYYLKSRKGKVLSGLKGISSFLASNYLKWLEDEIYFPLHSWSDVIDDLKTVSKGEKQGGLAYKILEEWNKLLIEQLTYSPSTFFERIGKKDGRLFELPAGTVKQWSTSLKKYAQDQFYKDYAQELLAFFKQEMLNCKGTETYPYETSSGSPFGIKYWQKLIIKLGRDKVWPYVPQKIKDYLLDEGWI